MRSSILILYTFQYTCIVCVSVHTFLYTGSVYIPVYWYFMHSRVLVLYTFQYTGIVCQHHSSSTLFLRAWGGRFHLVLHQPRRHGYSRHTPFSFPVVVSSLPCFLFLKKKRKKCGIFPAERGPRLLTDRRLPF